MKVVHAGGLTCAILMVAGSSFGQMFYPPSQNADDILRRFARSQGLQVESGKGTAIEQIVDAYAAKNNIQLKEGSTGSSWFESCDVTGFRPIIVPVGKWGSQSMARGLTSNESVELCCG